MKTVRRVDLAVVLCALIFLCVLVSCGGGGKGSDSAVETKPAKGLVSLPEGSAVSLSEVRVQGLLGEYPVDSDGSFDVEEPSGGPALVMLTDKDGHVMLMGYVDADSDDPAELSPLSTAVALMFMDIGANQLPPENWKKVFDLLAEEQAVKDLAAVIEARLALSITAVEDGDAEIKAAIEAARTALVPADFLNPAKSVRPAGASKGTKGAATPPVNIAVISENPVSGVRVSASDTSDGVVFTNEYRRHCYYWVYYTGYQDTNGVDHPLSSALWEKMGDGYLKSTNGLSGVIGTTLDFLWEKIPYNPVTAAPVTLTEMPEGAKQAYYKAVVVGAGSYPLLDQFPDWMADNVNRAEFAEMSLLMATVTVVKDYYLPIAFALAPASTANAMTGKDLSDFCAGIVGLVVKTGVNVTQNISLGDYDGAVRAMIKATLTDGTLRKALCQFIAKRLIKGVVTEAALKKMGDSANALNKILKTFDIGIMAVDLGAVTRDVYNSNKADYFDIVAQKPNVHIEPGAATLQPGKEATFNVIKGVVSGDTFEYRWSVAGTVGQLKKVGGTELAAFQVTRDPSIVYVASILAADKATDTLTVEVYRKQATDAGVVTQYIGTDQATVSITTKILIPATFHFDGPYTVVHDGTTFRYSVAYFTFPAVEGAWSYRAYYHGVINKDTGEVMEDWVEVPAYFHLKLNNWTMPYGFPTQYFLTLFTPPNPADGIGFFGGIEGQIVYNPDTCPECWGPPEKYAMAPYVSYSGAEVKLEPVFQ
jgi:hypothetical protein